VVRRLPNGNLLVPQRAEGEGVVGDGFVELAPGDEGYDEWAAYLERVGEPPADEGDVEGAR
jgi:hypothetical protein